MNTVAQKKNFKVVRILDEYRIVVNAGFPQRLPILILQVRLMRFMTQKHKNFWELLTASKPVSTHRTSTKRCVSAKHSEYLPPWIFLLH